MKHVLVGLATAFVLAGCGGVAAKAPLSTEADSDLDKRLIGMWEPTGEKIQGDGEPQRIAVGRVKGTERTLEMVVLHVEEEHVKVERVPLFATQIGEQRYLSMQVKGDAPDAKTAYFFLRYSIDDDGILTVAWLDEDVVGTLVEAKKLEGTVDRHRAWSEDKPRYDEVILDGSTPALRTWLGKAGDTVWDGKPMRFKKVDPGAPDRDDD